jgi:hypothetical protein
VTVPNQPKRSIEAEAIAAVFADVWCNKAERATIAGALAALRAACHECGVRVTVSLTRPAPDRSAYVPDVPTDPIGPDPDEEE